MKTLIKLAFFALITTITMQSIAISSQVANECLSVGLTISQCNQFCSAFATDAACLSSLSNALQDTPAGRVSSGTIWGPPVISR